MPRGRKHAEGCDVRHIALFGVPCGNVRRRRMRLRVVIGLLVAVGACSGRVHEWSPGTRTWRDATNTRLACRTPERMPVAKPESVGRYRMLVVRPSASGDSGIVAMPECATGGKSL